MNSARVAAVLFAVLGPALAPPAQGPQAQGPQAQGGRFEIEHFALRSGTNAALALDRRAGSLRVCVGGAFPAGGPQANALELLRATDAIALGTGELAAAVQRRGSLDAVPFVCANLVREGDGAAVFRTHVVRTVAGTRVALVGITAVPAAGSAPLPGCRVAEPAAALAALAPALAAEADVVVLLAAMDRIDCAELLRRVPSVGVALVPVRGGNDPEPLEVGGAFLVQSPAAPSLLARLSLDLRDGAPRVASAANRIEEVALADAERARLAPGAGSDGTALLAAEEPPRAAAAATPLAVGTVRTLALTARNRGVAVEVGSLRLVPAFGGRQAGPGNAWLVLDTTFRNVVPPAWAFERGQPPAYAADLADCLFLVAGHRLGRLDGGLSSGPSGLLRTPFALDRPGAERRGDLVFEVPAAPDTVELRCFDFVHGPLALTLVPAPAPAAAPPLAAPQRSDVLEAAVFGFERTKAFAGVGAPAGTTFVAVDFRARSLATVEVDATAIDPKAKNGDRAPAGAPVVWKDARQCFRLLADGVEHEASPASTLPEHARFVPEAWTGGVLAFAVPETAAALQLRFALPGSDRILQVTLQGPDLAAAGDGAAQRTDDRPHGGERGAGTATGTANGTASTGGPADGTSGHGASATETNATTGDDAVPPKGLAAYGLDESAIDAAIARGAAFLQQELATDGKGGILFGYPGEHVLMALALVHAGVQERDPAFRRALREMLQKRDVSTLGSYAAGLFCMLIEANGDPALYGRLRECARWLVEAQSASGSWTYGPKVDPALCSDPDRRVLQVTGGTPLSGAPEPVDAWQRTTPWNAHEPGDNSITQFALLGLRSAQRCGVPVPPETWRRAADWYRRGQRRDNGGFGYGVDGSDHYGSMTLAGISSLAICAHMLGCSDFAADPGVLRGIGWLRAHFAIDVNPESGSYWHYYLYSLERTGRILDREVVAGQEWYPLGARELLARQKASGAWAEQNGGETERLATSFALLFLTRSTKQLRVEVKRGGSGTLVTALQPAPDARFYVVLDASGSMLEQLHGKTKFDVARAAVAELFAGLPAGQQAALRAYGHRKRAVEPEADQDTELLLPMQAFDREVFGRRLAALRARGRTPLAASLRAAVQDLAGSGGDGPLVVLLLTDGGEDTMPRQDPVAAARELAKLPRLQLHVVGFDIQRDDWRKQLLAIAEAGGGTFWTAGAEDLARELRRAVLREPEGFAVKDERGAEVAAGRFGDRVTLPEGRYRLATGFGGKEFAADLWINTDAETAVVFAGSEAVHVTQGRAGASLCGSCGKPVGADARFCGACGARVAR